MNNNFKLYKFYADFGQGDLYGLFLATDEEIENIIGQPIYFGEVLGKHSDVYFDSFDYSDLQEIEGATDELINALYKLFGKTLCGYNPVVVYQENQEDNLIWE